MGLLLVLALAFICAGLSGTIAFAKGWVSASWFMAGFFFGPLGLIAAAGLPDRRLRHYLYELSKQQGVASESLEPLQATDTDSSSAYKFAFDFKVDEQTTDDELWDLILVALAEDIKIKASRDKSDLNTSTTRLIIRAADGSYLMEARRIKRSHGTSYWNLMNKV